MRIAALLVGAGLLVAAAPALAEEARREGAEPRVRDVRVADATKVAPSPTHRGSPRPDGHHRPGGYHRPGSRSHSGVRVGVGWYGYRGWYPSSYYGWGPAWGARWDPWWYGPAWGYAGYTAVYPRAGWKQGALDVDISPERAEVWLDGERIGVADDFDGFPDYLWLPEGTYDVVFYSPGRRTLARQYSIYAGLVIDVEDRLEEGDAIHPLDLGPKTHERRDERLRRDREQREYVEQIERERARPVDGDDGEATLDARGEPGRLELAVTPEDASVYLDGRLLGSGRELGRLRAGLLVDAGTHRLEVVRPGYRSIGLEVTVGEGEEERVAVELEPEPHSAANVR